MKIEEIQAFIKDNGGNVADFVVRTKEEDASYVQNFANAEIEKVIDPKTREIHDKYDEIIFSVTGLRKNAGEKTLNFQKRILEDLKANADKLPALEQEITSLKDKVGKNADAKLIADLENVRNEFATFKTAKENELESLRKETELSRKRAIIESELNAFEFDPSVKEGVLKVYRDTVINSLLQSSEFRDNNLVYLDDKGNPLRNQAKNLAPYTTNEIVAERLKDVIKQKRVITGPPAPGDPKLPPKSVPDGIKTKVQLSEHLMKEGFKRGTKEYDEVYTELGAELPLE